jgi:major membrane immunogen (membrane-anchored lipoprotein)
MKRLLTILILLFISCSPQQPNTGKIYQDGIFKYKTKPDRFGFQTKIEIRFLQDKAVELNWHIYDTGVNRIFDKSYENILDSQEFKEKCRSDYIGHLKYAPQLLEKQGGVLEPEDADKVDVVTGATWSHKKFNQVVKETLAKAKLKKIKSEIKKE